MVRLNRSMMERYEIADRRPDALRAVLFGLDPMMLCAAARLLDCANASGGNFGAVCVSGSDEAEQLRAQDGMFTLLVRGEREDGSPIREERVVQSILEVASVEDGLRFASRPELDLFMLSALLSPEEYVEQAAIVSRYLRARWEAKLPAPQVVLLSASPASDSTSVLRACVAEFAALAGNSDFSEWVNNAPFQTLLVNSLFGELSDSEFAKAQRDMNYQDRFLLWAEPLLKCTAEGSLPAELASVCGNEDFSVACERKSRVFDSLMFLCASAGFLSGMDSFSQVLRDETLRAFIGRAFFDELLPALPWPREEVSPFVISAFSRLENSMNDVPLLRAGLFGGFCRSLLPSIRAHAAREFESPALLSLAFAAAIMVYAGARKNDGGKYEILRGRDNFLLNDEPDILQAFSLLSHDMPAESLAYAVLADRDLWGADLREIDGLEMRLSLDLASIQRVGFRETLRQRESTEH